jgi:hypothetical protein
VGSWSLDFLELDCASIGLGTHFPDDVLEG